jgi:hypothetical protein
VWQVDTACTIGHISQSLRIVIYVLGLTETTRAVVRNVADFGFWAIGSVESLGTYLIEFNIAHCSISCSDRRASRSL